ncbi:hypothetical protein HYU92_00920 [Candidatus Curtissbacteria bacterium]|nr:hypothetical protein [Candidatus Curtissbacteria bacterium]
MFIPIFLFFLILKRGGISDIDVTKREERYKLFGGMTVILIIPTIFAYIFGNNLFFVLHLISLIAAFTLYLITLRFKISGHLIMNSGGIFIINYLFDWKLLWLFVIVLIVAFARIYLKKHTILEILTGGLVGFLVPYLVLKFFKLI